MDIGRWGSWWRRRGRPEDAAPAPGAPPTHAPRTARQQAGDAAEAHALRLAQRRGLALVERNYRVALGRSRRGGEIDLILRSRDGTLVFVEVRARSGRQHGGAAATVSAAKRRSIVYAAQHYLAALPRVPPCRFDVVAVEGEQVTWLEGAFDAET